jgi:large subunit ribosomal protein L17
MRHLKRKRNLGISPSHRSALLKNLATSILDKERIVTTIAKAKEARGVVERLITYGKRGGLHAVRLAAKIIHDKTILHKLFMDIAPSYKEREGGYTRIIKLGQRKGDNAPTSIIELVGAKEKKAEKTESSGRGGKGTKEWSVPAAERGGNGRPEGTRYKEEKAGREKKGAGQAEEAQRKLNDGNGKERGSCRRKAQKAGKGKKDRNREKEKNG